MRNPEDLDEYLAPAADAISAAIIRLAERLVRLGLTGEGDPWVPDYLDRLPLVTGEIVPAVHTRESTYWEQGRELIEQREAADRTKYRRIGADGEPGPWRDAPAPLSRAASN